MVLVVEDEIFIRLATADLLRDSGYRVLEAASAAEALELLDATAAINLVITDVRMPGARDGLALAREVRQRWPGLPVVIASGHLDEDRDGLADRFLRKPYTDTQILDAAVELIAPPWTDRPTPPLSSC